MKSEEESALEIKREIKEGEKVRKSEKDKMFKKEEKVGVR